MEFRSGVQIAAAHPVGRPQEPPDLAQHEPLGAVPDSDQQKQRGQADAQQIPDERSVPL